MELSKYDLYVHKYPDNINQELNNCITTFGNLNILCDEAQKLYNRHSSSQYNIIKVLFYGSLSCSNNSLNLKLHSLELKNKIANGVQHFENEDYEYLCVLEKSCDALNDIIPGQIISRRLFEFELQLNKNKRIKQTCKLIMELNLEEWSKICLICPYLRTDEYDIIYSLIEKMISKDNTREFLDQHKEQLTELSTIINTIDILYMGTYNKQKETLETEIQNIKENISKNEHMKKQYKDIITTDNKRITKLAKEFVKDINKQRTHTIDYDSVNMYNYVCTQLYNQSVSSLLSSDKFTKDIHYEYHLNNATNCIKSKRNMEQTSRTSHAIKVAYLTTKTYKTFVNINVLSKISIDECIKTPIELSNNVKSIQANERQYLSFDNTEIPATKRNLFIIVLPYSCYDIEIEENQELYDIEYRFFSIDSKQTIDDIRNINYADEKKIMALALLRIMSNFYNQFFKDKLYSMNEFFLKTEPSNLLTFVQNNGIKGQPSQSLASSYRCIYATIHYTTKYLFSTRFSSIEFSPFCPKGKDVYYLSFDTNAQAVQYYSQFYNVKTESHKVMTHDVSEFFDISDDKELGIPVIYKCDPLICNISEYNDTISKYREFIRHTKEYAMNLHKNETELKNLKQPKSVIDSIFIPKTIQNQHFSNDNYELQNVILILDSEFKNIYLPKDNAFRLPNFIPSIHYPCLSIPIINPKHVPIEIIKPKLLAHIEDSMLKLTFGNELKDEDFKEIPIDILIGNNHLSINIVINVNLKEKVLYINEPCEVTSGNKLKCFTQAKEISIVRNGSVLKANTNNSTSIEHFSIQYDRNSPSKNTAHYFLIDGNQIRAFENRRYQNTIKLKKQVEIPDLDQLFTHNIQDYVNILDLMPLYLIQKDSKVFKQAYTYLVDNIDNYVTCIQNKIKIITSIVSSDNSLLWENIQDQDNHNQHIEKQKQELNESDSDDNIDSDDNNSDMSIQEYIPGHVSGLNYKGHNQVVLNGKITDGLIKSNVFTFDGEFDDSDSDDNNMNHNKMSDEEKKHIQEKKKRDAEESQKNQQTIESSDVIKRFEMMNLNTIFEKHILSRITNISFIEPKCTTKDNKLINKQNSIIDKVFNDSTTIYDEIKPLLSKIYDAIFNNSFTDSSSHSELNQHSYIQCVSIILDMNVTHRKHKSRLRTEVAILILYLCNELGIPTRIYCTGARGQGFIISEEDDCLTSKISKVFDLECVKKTPSTPLDIFCYEDIVIDDNTNYFLISDCFSEQLLSNLPIIQKSLLKYISHLFLIHIKGNNDEALSKKNEIILEQLISQSFTNDSFVSVQSFEECEQLTKKEKFIKLFYSKVYLKANKTDIIIPFESDHKLSTSIPIFENINDSDTSYSVLKFQSGTQIEIHLPEINDSFLFYEPFYSVNDQLFSFLSGKVPSDVLFEALNNSVLIPNKPTSWVPSTTGTIINTSAFFKFLLTGSGDGRFFKKKTGNKIRDYAVSIVIDASQQAFCDINKSHSYSTILLLLRGLSEMNLNHIDIFIAHERCIKVATGISSDRLWSQSIVCSILDCLRTPYYNTCMSTTLEYAYSTMRIRSESSILFVFTNGTICGDEHLNIQKIFTSSDITAIGVGIGYMLHSYEDMYPTFMWSANPKAIRDSLLNMSYDSDTKIAYDINENDPTYTGLSELNVVVTNQDLTQNIINTKGKYEGIAGRYQLFAMSDEGTKEGSKKQMDSSFDLVKDNSLKGERVLFIILYLCRNIVDKKTHNIIDPDITKENLENGKLINGKRMSPVQKLISKGMRVDIVYDYKHAIDALMSGDYRETFITCSPGDGKLPNVDYDGTNECTIEFEDKDLIQFINCLNIFVNNGGNIMFMLENYPFSYEAEIYFKEFYHFDLIPDKEKRIQGGQTMKLDATEGKETADRRGTFIKVGTDPLQNSEVFPIGTGITQIYEGNTLAAMNENALRNNNFSVFARDCEGNAAIMLSYGDNKKGRIIIDSAASKLFLEFTTEGTARWISNVSAWLLNQERYYTDAFDGNKIPHDIEIPDNPNLYEHRFEVERRSFDKSPNFILSILLDCTSSMRNAIIQTRDNIIRALNDLERIKTQKGYDSTEIYCQFIGYRNYPQKGGIQQLPSPLTTNISEVRDYIMNNVNSDGGTECGCADVEGAIELANQRTRQFPKEDNVHVIIIMGDMPAFGCISGCACTKRGRHTYTGETYSSRWTKRARELVETDTSIYFLPINVNYLLLTKEMLSRYYDGRKLKQSEQATDSTFSNVFVELIKDSFVETMGGIS